MEPRTRNDMLFDPGICQYCDVGKSQNWHLSVLRCERVAKISTLTLWSQSIQNFNFPFTQGLSLYQVLGWTLHLFLQSRGALASCKSAQ